MKPSAIASIVKTLEPRWLHVWRTRRQIKSLTFQIDLMEEATRSREPHKALAMMRARRLGLRRHLLDLGVTSK